MTSVSVEQISKTNTDILTGGGTAAFAGLQELAKAYQALATKNMEKLTSSIQAFAAVKSPVEFVELQRKLIAESVDAAVSDCGNITKLTTAVFTAALEPMQKQVEAMQRPMRK